jgi:hypothetical protein
VETGGRCAAHFPPTCLPGDPGVVNGKRVMVVLPAYNAALTLERTVAEIPPGVADEVLLVDDASHDETVVLARRLGLPVVVHPRNRGYGGNLQRLRSPSPLGQSARWKWLGMRR